MRMAKRCCDLPVRAQRATHQGTAHTQVTAHRLPAPVSYMLSVCVPPSLRPPVPQLSICHASLDALPPLRKPRARADLASSPRSAASRWSP